MAVERQILFWFKPTAAGNFFHPDRCPIHLWEGDRGRFFYSFPDLGTGVKIARHQEGEITSTDNSLPRDGQARFGETLVADGGVAIGEKFANFRAIFGDERGHSVQIFDFHKIDLRKQ